MLSDEQILSKYTNQFVSRSKELYEDKKNFQPMNINFGLFPDIVVRDERGKYVKGKERKKAMSQRALADMESWQNNLAKAA